MKFNVIDEAKVLCFHVPNPITNFSFEIKILHLPSPFRTSTISYFCGRNSFQKLNQYPPSNYHNYVHLNIIFKLNRFIYTLFCQLVENVFTKLEKIYKPFTCNKSIVHIFSRLYISAEGFYLMTGCNISCLLPGLLDNILYKCNVLLFFRYSQRGVTHEYVFCFVRQHNLANP